MKKNNRPMDVLEVSELCSVARSTVSHWIAKKGLPAYREGKKFMIEGGDLARFLRLRGYRLPEPLRSLGLDLPPVQSQPQGPECEAFSPNAIFQDLLAFIHQIRKPAFIFSGLRILACNRQLAELVGAQTAEVVGNTITTWIHPDSLEQAVAFNKKRTMGQVGVPENYALFLNGAGAVKLNAQIMISPLDQPENTWMAIVITATAVERGDIFSESSPKIDPDRPEGGDSLQ